MLAATESKTLTEQWGNPLEDGCAVECALSVGVYCYLRASELRPTTRDTPISCFRSAVQLANELVKRKYHSLQVFIVGLAYRIYSNTTRETCICQWEPCRCGELLEWTRELFEEGKLAVVRTFLVIHGPPEDLTPIV